MKRKSRQTNFRLASEVVDLLEAVADKHGIDKTKVVEICVWLYAEKEVPRLANQAAN